MRRTRRTRKLSSENESSNDEHFQTKKPKKPKKEIVSEVKITKNEDSSSESDIDNYLKSVSELDLNSPFFQTNVKPKTSSFENIEKTILSDVKKLSDSSSENEQISEEQILEPTEDIPHSSNSKIHFQHLHDYTKRIEEARIHVENYLKKQKTINDGEMINTKETTSNFKDDILSMLTETESQKSISSKDSLLNKSFESESEKEDWEEVQEDLHNETEKSTSKDIQITVSLPEHMRQKKGKDLLAAMKRRLNRVKKENQVLIHKVHLLCWIAHGNYVNNILNDPKLLSAALSLIPSQNCYPQNRADLKYLEQIVTWYSKTVSLEKNNKSTFHSLLESLEKQIEKKEAENGKIYVYIFICILRALGLQCRLVLSFRVEPLRPFNSEMHSLSQKELDKEKKVERKEKSNKEKIQKITTEKVSKHFEKVPKNISVSSKYEKVKMPPETFSKKVANKVVSLTKKDSKSSEGKINKEKTKKTSKNVENKEITLRKSSRKTNENSLVSSTVIDATIPNSARRISKTNTKIGAFSKNSPSGTAAKISKINMKAMTRTKQEVLKSKTKIDAISTESPKTSVNSLKSSSKTEMEKSSKTKVSSRTLRSRNKPIPQLDGAYDDLDVKSTSKPNFRKLHEQPKKKCEKTHRKRLRTPPQSNYKEISSDSEDDFHPSPSYKLNKDVQNTSSSSSTMKTIEKKQRNKSTEKKKKRIKEESDEEFKIKSEVIKKANTPNHKVKDRIKWKNDRRVLSSDSDISNSSKKGSDVWIEVFLEAEEKWISVDVIKVEIHCIKSLYSRSSKPVSYILAWNNDNSIKDVTSRYCPDWHTVTRKLRVDSDWWQETLRPFKGVSNAKDKEEDEELAQMQLEQPLPKTISEFKNHPLYALQRHLLKFEAIYPPDAVPLGYVRSEPIYSRHCVYTLHSREIWLKQAKTVKPGEKPYKIVKARPKYDKLSGKIVTDLLLEIFGMWQVQDYDPPTAENGKVPRNAYGNVDLFKECMLPKGCVHLRLPGLHKVAYKMKIDCAEAVTGFDFHGGWSHPVIDGYVVCEENEDSLIAAWYMEREEQEKKEREKIEKRVYGNWKKLIRGLLIKEKLKIKYNFGDTKIKTKNNKRKVISDDESNSN